MASFKFAVWDDSDGVAASSNGRVGGPAPGPSPAPLPAPLLKRPARATLKRPSSSSPRPPSPPPSKRKATQASRASQVDSNALRKLVPTTQPRRPVTVAGRIGYASDCSGLDGGSFALRYMGVDFDHLFSSEVHPNYRRVLEATHPDIMTVFHDMTTRKPRDLHPFLGRVTCYTSGFPCQPFSSIGSQAGAADERGSVVWHCVLTIHELLPDVFILENVKRFTERRFKKQFMDALASLRSIGGNIYNVDWRVLDSQNFGVPARRERLYIVGMRRDRQCAPWSWPKPQSPVSLSTILDPTTPGVKQLPHTTLSSTAQRNIELGVDVIVSKHPDVNPLDQPWVIDICNSPTYGANVALDKFPTITKTRARSCGYYLLQNDRLITEDELLRAQGFKPCDVKLPTHVTMPKNIRAEMSGNAFTVTIFQALFGELLPAIGVHV